MEESKDYGNRSVDYGGPGDAYSHRAVTRQAKNAEEVVVPAHNLKQPIDFNLVSE